MMNRYFVLLLLPIVLFGCSTKSKPQQQSLAPAETSVSDDSQVSEVENNVDSNSESNPAPIATIPRRTSYSPQLVNNFMGACIQNGSTQTNCGCTLNTFQQNFSEPEYIRMEQQFITTGKLPEFVMQEIRNNCNNSGIQTPIARSQQEQILKLEAKYKDRERLSQQISQMQQRSHEASIESISQGSQAISDMSRIFAAGLARSWQTPQGTLSGALDTPNHPCDYLNQRDSQGKYCGDRSAVIRPGGRF